MNSAPVLRKRNLVYASVLAALMSPSPQQPAHAQTYPYKPIRLIVPFAPGGGADYFARPMSSKLSETLGQSIVVDNRAGANGAIGAEAVMNATADGYTLLFGSAGVLTIGPAVNSKLRYDPQKDFVPIALIVDTPFSLIVHPSVGARTVKDLVAIARANPGKLSYGSSGVGGAPHLAGELFDHIGKTKTLHVAYKGIGPMVTDLLAGRVQMTFIGINVVQQHVAAGKLVVLATAGNRRSPLAPDVPTLTEAGLAGFAAGTWYGVLAPADTPRVVVSKLNGEINRVFTLHDMKELLARTGAEPADMTPEQFGAFMRTEREKWTRLVKSANIKLRD